MATQAFEKDFQYIKFCAYGFLKNLRFFDAFLLLYFLEIGLIFTEIGVLYAIREIMINISEVPSGILADRYGRKYALIFAFAIYIASFVIYYYASNFYVLALAIGMYGVAEAFRSGVHKSMIMEYLSIKGWDDSKIAYYGHTRSWSQVGSAISSVIAGFLVLYSGNYRLIFLISIIPYVLNFFNILSYPESINLAENESKQTSNIRLKETFVNFWNSVRKPAVLRIMHSSSIFSSYIKASKDYMQTIMFNFAILLPILADYDKQSKSGLIIGFIYFFIFLFNAFASKNASFFTKKKKKYNLVTMSLYIGFSIGILCGLLESFSLYLAAILCFMLMYMIENTRKPILVGHISDQVANQSLGSVLSAQSFLTTLLTSGIAISLGFMTDLLGLGLAFMIISGLLILSVLILQLGITDFKNSQ